MTGQMLFFYGFLWVTLMRALLVKVQVLPATCCRCGLGLERRSLGATVCSCRH